MRKNSILEQLYEFISSLSIISTHSHHLSDDQLENIDLNFLLSNSYPSWVCSPPGPDPAARHGYLLANRCNSYFRWLFEGIRLLYGLDVAVENFDELDARIKSAHKEKSYHLTILKQNCRYERIILDKYDNPGSDNGHPDIFVPAYRINMFMQGYSRTACDHNHHSPYDHINVHGVTTFEEYLDAVRTEIRSMKKQGAVALKNATAYERNQIYDNMDEALAYRAFNNPNATNEDIKNFSDYIMFAITQVAEELDLPIQWHTGLGIIDDTRAIGLRKLLQSFTNVKFDIFHAGYPWTSYVLALLHNFKNVYVDLCWLPLLSTTEAKHFLKKALEVSSAHKICWGCDTWTSEESFGAVLAIRHVLADVLADMVVDGAMDIEYAQYVAKRILNDNPKELFKL